MIRPSKLWKSNKTAPAETPDVKEAPSMVPTVTAIEPSPLKHTKTLMAFPSMKMKPKMTVPLLSPRHHKEVYELSTVNDSGVYLAPPAAAEVAKDHPLWADDAMDDAVVFDLPALDCLTTTHGPHSFYTPSSTLLIHA
ncbi:hypothetical protein BC940DRAFT_318815 [Gongronella butleri]|nr:hypothetical protein BC940DRAFT_318815 [Gongronella butleri]